MEKELIKLRELIIEKGKRTEFKYILNKNNLGILDENGDVAITLFRNNFSKRDFRVVFSKEIYEEKQIEELANSYINYLKKYKKVFTK